METGFNFGKMISRAKEQGKIFFVAEKDGKNIKIYSTEAQARVPDFIAGIVIEVCKNISKGSGNKYSATKALDALLTHISTTARIVLENYEHEILNSGDIPTAMTDNGSDSIN